MTAFISVLSFSRLYLPTLRFRNNKRVDTLAHLTFGNIQSAMVERTTGDWLLTGGFQAVSVTRGG